MIKQRIPPVDYCPVTIIPITEELVRHHGLSEVDLHIYDLIDDRRNVERYRPRITEPPFEALSCLSGSSTTVSWRSSRGRHRHTGHLDSAQSLHVEGQEGGAVRRTRAVFSRPRGDRPAEDAHEIVPAEIKNQISTRRFSPSGSAGSCQGFQRQVQVVMPLRRIFTGVKATSR